MRFRNRRRRPRRRWLERPLLPTFDLDLEDVMLDLDPGMLDTGWVDALPR